MSDSARTVLEALLRRIKALGVAFETGARVHAIAREPGGGFRATLADGSPRLGRRLIVATGGLALPKSGSDGTGLDWLRAWGHATIPTTPALAPLVLREGRGPGGRFAELAGITLEVRLRLRDGRGAVLAECIGSAVWTHFGLSGPAPMNLSRHVSRRCLDHPEDPGRVELSHPLFENEEAADRWLQRQAELSPKRLTTKTIEDLYPARLSEMLAGEPIKLAELARERRHELARALAALPLDVAGDRGYSFAETTAGGIDLAEIDARTMESRRVGGLHLCGEILDVDGRIGGFNFQWAWASGYLAGRGAVAALRAANNSTDGATDA